MEEWNGYPCERLIFENHEAFVVSPKDGQEENHRLAVKTEYWNAFPHAAETELLANGFHLCFLKNDNRWGTDPDLDRKARFLRFVQAKYRLAPKCVLIGMSCGGLIAVNFAVKYPRLVSCLYLDAPVINFMSCPCGFGVGGALPGNPEEILDALGMKSVSELLSCRSMPLDRLPQLAASRIPVVLVAGDSDRTVPFCENGALLQKACGEAGTELEVYIKPGCDHHPHGLPDPAPVVNFILRHC